MRTFLAKWFKKWAAKNRITDKTLLDAVLGLQENKGVADLGASLYKVRVRMPSRGKSGGYRTLLMYKEGVRCVFFSGFGKNEKSNLSDEELHDLKVLAKTYSSMSDVQFEKLVGIGLFFEIGEK
jgi:hypothetical protein